FVADRQRYIHGIHASYLRRLDADGIALLPSRGRLLDAHTVETADGARLRAKQILVATGSHPRRPDVPGAELGGVSDDFFALCDAPDRVAIVGGGYIAVELAGVLQALGSRVDVFARSGRLLGHVDAELADRLQDNYRQQGVHMRFGYRLAALQRGGDGRLSLRDADGEECAGYDEVIFAVGRVANTRGIGLEAAGVSLDADGNIAVDAWQRSSVG